MSKSTVAFIIGKVFQVGGVLLLSAFGVKKGHDKYKEKSQSNPKK